MESTMKRVLSGLTVHELAQARNIINDLLSDHSVTVKDIAPEISVRLKHALEAAGITNLLQVTKLYKSQFEKLRGVGVLTLQEMEKILDYYDLSFKADQLSLSYSM